MQNAALHCEGEPRPVLVYDGDCRFCCFWVARWQRMTGDRVEYLPSDVGKTRYPEVPEKAFQEAVQLFLPEGGRLSGSDAVLKLLEYAPAPWPEIGRLLVWLPGGRKLLAWGYRRVARRRALLWQITKRIWKP